MMKPDFVPALIDLGSLAAEKGDLPGAADNFSRAAVLDPENPSIHYNMAKGVLNLTSAPPSPLPSAIP